MKSIGDQAREFRESKGWNSRKMADAVGTSRQNIENLEEKGHLVPRYIADLARAMGTTVDVLMTGRFVAEPQRATQALNSPTPIGRAIPKPPRDDVKVALQVIDGAVRALDASQIDLLRKTFDAYLTGFRVSPALIQVVEDVLSGEDGTDQQAAA